MSCAHLEESLALYAGGDLDPVEAAGVESHLSGCAECRAFLDQMNQSLLLIREETVDWSAVEVMHQRTMSALQPPRFHIWRYAAAVVLVMGGLASWRSQAPVTVPPPPAIPVAVAQPKMLPLPAVPVATRAKNVRKAGKHETMVVKLQTDDPDVVIYWITD
jgi:anti-sigma factor ChrR (cupin superfamily)